MPFEQDLSADCSNVIWMVILQLNVTFQNIVYYYFIYLYAQDGPQSLFISGLVILENILSHKFCLLWII